MITETEIQTAAKNYAKAICHKGVSRMVLDRVAKQFIAGANWMQKQLKAQQSPAVTPKSNGCPFDEPEVDRE